jgi:hypothetical protein
MKSRKQEGKNILAKQEVSGLNSIWGSSGLYDPAHTKGSGKKISIQHSTRIQESIPEDKYFAAFTIVGDMSCNQSDIHTPQRYSRVQLAGLGRA